MSSPGVGVALVLLLAPAAAQYLQVTQCDNAVEYFDNSALSCYPCEGSQAETKNKVPDTSDLDIYGNAQSCTCKPGFYEVPTACGLGEPEPSKVVCTKFSCEPCPANHAVSQDKSACLPCTKPRSSAAPTPSSTNSSNVLFFFFFLLLLFNLKQLLGDSVFDATTFQCKCPESLGGSSRIVGAGPTLR